ncbi:trypsin-like serine peptidase [Kitasatospora sp. NPDC096147]|uniref:trypsin-like serine peptidase n=1 Tax=Kitasatospora sp. NPDC096147 TaxID=3364093 RepID=UPI0038160334
MTIWHRLGLAALLSLLFAVTPAAARNATPVETAQAAAAAPAELPAAVPAAAPVEAPAADPDAVAQPEPSPAASPAPAPSPSPAASPSAVPAEVSLGTTGTAPPGPEADRVGVLGSGGQHFCTASVIDSPGGSLAVTAAHCVSSADGLTFTPAYRNGEAPYGTWRVTAIHATDGWQDSGDPDQDYALLDIAPDPATGRTIQSVLGGTPVDFAAPLATTARLYGYPARTDTPLLCTNATTAQSPTQRRIDCPGYPGGTSGGPFVDTATGHLIGVIGGHQEGGDTEDTSYGAVFGPAFRALYQDATG